MRHFQNKHMELIRIDNCEERNLYIEEVQKSSVVNKVHFKPIPMVLAYKNERFSVENYQNAYNYYKISATLSFYSVLKDEKVNYIVQSIRFIL